MKIERFTVEGKDYQTQLFPAREALAMIARIGKLLGGDLHTLKINSDDDKGVGIALIAKMVYSLVDKDPELKIVQGLLKYTTQDLHSLNNGQHFDELFTGNYYELMQVVGEVIKANHFLPKELIGNLPSIESLAQSNTEA